MVKGCFVAGTDTGVGKTLIACALLHRLRERGLKAVGMKPIAAGCERTAEGLINEDVEALRAAGSIVLPREAINVYAFEQPVAPHIAAAAAGVQMTLAAIEQRYAELAALADAVVVEGAGGWLVPLNDADTLADLAVRLGLPVILVVGMRLGCLSHALLTAEAIRSRRVPLTGWVANQVDPHMACPEENVRSLQARIGCPLLARVPFQAIPNPASVEFDSLPVI